MSDQYATTGYNMSIFAHGENHSGSRDQFLGGTSPKPSTPPSTSPISCTSMAMPSTMHASPEFRSFYYELVRPFIVNYQRTGAYDTDFTIALLALPLWPIMRDYMGMFKLDDFIANWWHSDWCKEDVIAGSEDTVLVHGGKDVCAK